ncbi:MAG: hypothetical protein K9M80_00865 [Candidatus Marinimicrobia bacterium]|nr:hypothetical protein [Candidatus Neomarinimicrobiota bacterium]
MTIYKDLLKKEKLTENSFQSPPDRLNILPFWFWNGELKKSELEWQLKEYYDRGIPGLFIHGRFGLKVPYLSEEWFDRVEFVVKKAREIGIDIWIYDEMNWPSGSANKQVIEKYPHLGQKYLEMVILWIDGPLFTYLEATDSRYINTNDAKPIAAYACSQEEFENGIENLIDLTPNLSFDKVIPWEAPEGKWVMMYFLEKEIDYYIDALNPESTYRFIELTHERYKDAVGKDFGDIVPGFYTDEPAMHYYQVGMDNYVIPWSSQMFKIFRERNGYSLKPHLPALYQKMDSNTSKIRYDFWKTLSDQYDDSYYKQIRDWCEDNNLIFTGHLMFEHWLRGHARCGGNVFQHLKNMHMTGVDHLYPRIGSEEAPQEHVELKLASSAAHHFGSPRLLCESMGGTYWDCTLERMKWIANWEYVLGVNIFNNHGYHYSIEGERKRDWPPSQFYHHTWWKYYDRFTTYISRLGHTLSAGHHIADVLILYPMTSMWTNYVPQGHTDISSVIEEDYNDLADALLRLHFDYDYVDEDILADAIIENGKININEEQYSVLILPPLTHIKQNTFKVLQEYIDQGGKVIANRLLPVELVETEDKIDGKKLERCFKIDPQNLLDDFNAEEVKEEVLNPEENIYIFKGNELSVDVKRERLGRVLNQCLNPDAIIEHEDVFYLHRQQDDMHIYFLINSLQEDIGEVSISFRNVGHPEIWNPQTGDTQPIYPFKVEEDRIKLELNFDSSQSYILMIRNPIPDEYVTESNLTIDSVNDGRIVGVDHDNEDKPFVKIQQKGGEQILKASPKKKMPSIKLKSPFQFDIEDDNTLCISDWKMKVDENQDSNSGYYEEDYDDSNWLSVTNGAWEMQLPQERDEEIYPQTVLYRTWFTIDDMPENTRVLIDGFSGSDYTLFINGQEVRDKGKRSKLDAEINEVDIQNYLKKGKNLVAIQLIVNRRTDGILDLLKIVGDFALKLENEEYCIVKRESRINTGDWTEKGFPYYSGTGIYSTKFELAEEYVNDKLFLEVDCGEDVLEVRINDSPAIVNTWHPYKIDITDHVKEGENRIEMKVTNTLINMLEAKKKPSGIFKNPVIKHKRIFEFKY